MIYDSILESLYNGNAESVRAPQIQCAISDTTYSLLNKKEWSADDIHTAEVILKISNIMYNNTSDTILPLDDGLYDQLLVRYQSYNPNYPIGAKPIRIDELQNNEVVDLLEMCTLVPKSDDKHLYIDDILNQRLDHHHFTSMAYIPQESITKRLVNTTHKYPELVGTLDKCKMVTNSEAKELGVFENTDIQIFERDFLRKCLDVGIIDMEESFEMVGELKYDGVSIEAEICGDTIISALSRGDTSDNIASDLTPILGGYKFRNVDPKYKDLIFGMKFEAVITKENLRLVSEIRGKDYKNARNAIIGILGASDAYRFKEFITLIPLSTSMSPQLDRVAELDFINKNYNSGEYNRYVVFRGNYISMLYQVKQFRDSAERVRSTLPYLIDGIVISFTDKDKINRLGRVNSVNKYSMAIKFNPKRVRTIFTGYSFSIGKTGEIIPMAHFKPCEFLGGIHTKQTIHSYQRFKELSLRYGQEVDIEYRNDVITYLSKPDTEYNKTFENIKPIEFPTKCPSCGKPISISDTGKKAMCTNINCSERNIYRVVAMLDTLNIPNFGEETIRSLGIKSIKEYLEYPIEKASILGPNESKAFIENRDTLFKNPLPDYKIMASVGIPGIGEEKFKIILREYTVEDLQMASRDDFDKLTEINGIGSKLVDTLYTYMNIFRDDIEAIYAKIPIIPSKGQKQRQKICVTGTRDSELLKAIEDAGYDIGSSVTKDTIMLIALDPNSSSTKITKAKALGIPICNIGDGLERIRK